MTAETSIRDYAFDQMNRLLTRLAFQVHRAAQRPGPAEIHDLRVGIRRFAQGLLLFDDFFPDWEVKRIKKRLKRMMHLTSEIRDCDIALEFLEGTKDTVHRRRFERERAAFERQFSEMLQRWSSHDFSAKWRSGLSLRSV